MKPSVLAPELRDWESQQHLERFVQQPRVRTVKCVLPDIQPREPRVLSDDATRLRALEELG